MPSPLIVTGTARSGSTLLCRMLSAHPEIMVAADPFFPIFKAVRNAVIKLAPAGPPAGFSPDMPFQDYYFSRPGIEAMDILQSGSLASPCSPDEWSVLGERTAARAAIECPDIATSVPQMVGPDFKTIFDRGLAAIAQVRACQGRKWVGIKEVWVIDFMPLLARAYPDAKFIVISRDPRAVAASLLSIAKKDPTQMAHMLSYMKHWRKYAAFIEHYSADENLKGRMHHLRYEDLMTDPVGELKKACGFLDVDYDGRMTDFGSYRDYSTGGTWQGNSSYEGRGAGLDKGLAETWRKHLPADVVGLVEFICDPDMRMIGYEPMDSSSPADGAGVLDYINKTVEGQYSWRSDFRDPQADYGFELFRKAMIDSPSPAANADLIRRSFLFEDVYRKVRSFAGRRDANV